MNLEEMKRIAAARTKGKWKHRGRVIEREDEAWIIGAVHSCDETINEEGGPNMEFIAMAANNIDKLLAVVEAARRAVNYQFKRPADLERIKLAIEALEME